MSVLTSHREIIIIDQLTKEGLLCVDLGIDTIRSLFQPPNFDLYSVPAILIKENNTIRAKGLTAGSMEGS